MIAISIPSTNLLLLRIRFRTRHTISRNDRVEPVLDFTLDQILYVLDGTSIILIRTLSFCSFMLVYHKRTPSAKRRFCRRKHAMLQRTPLQNQIITNNDYIMETDWSELRCCSQRVTLRPRPSPVRVTLFTRWKETPRSPRYTSMECSSYDRLIPSHEGCPGLHDQGWDRPWELMTLFPPTQLFDRKRAPKTWPGHMGKNFISQQIYYV